MSLGQTSNPCFMNMFALVIVSLSLKQNLNLLLGYLNQLCIFLMNKKWNIWSRFLKMHFSCHVHYIHIWLYRVFRWYVVNFYDPDQVNLIYFTPFGAVNFLLLNGITLAPVKFNSALTHCLIFSFYWYSTLLTILSFL